MVGRGHAARMRSARAVAILASVAVFESLALLQLALPLVLIAWQAASRPGSRLEWALRTLGVGACIVALAVAGLWMLLPWPLPWILLGLFGGATWLSLRSWRRAPPWPRGGRGLFRALLAGVLAVAGSSAAFSALSGWRRPGGEPVRLAFPLRGGTFAVASGGSHPLLNPHLEPPPRARARGWLAQSHAVDLVALNRWGMRARGLQPASLDDYAVFGAAVVAPCDGGVVDAVDGLPDRVPPASDPDHLAGNHVVLACRDARGEPFWVLLAHLRSGSVQVAAGEDVRVGDPIGRVGNSGKTTEPHLHVHAQRPAPPEALLSGAPLPALFDGRWLVRNQRITR